MPSIILIILFCSLKILLLYEELPQNIMPQVIRVKIRIINHLHVILWHTWFTALIAKQAAVNLGTITSTWRFQQSVLSVTIPRNFTLKVLDTFFFYHNLHSNVQVRYYWFRTEYSGFSSRLNDSKLALNHSFAFLNIVFISLGNLCGPESTSSQP